MARGSSEKQGQGRPQAAHRPHVGGRHRSPAWGAAGQPLASTHRKYRRMGSQATSRMTMEGSSTRSALMAEMYKVMMSHVLTPANR